MAIYTNLPVPGEQTDQWDDKLVQSLLEAQTAIELLQTKVTALEARQEVVQSTGQPTDTSKIWIDSSV